MTAPVLVVEKLKIEFALRGRFLTAIDEVSLEINQGEVLGMVGESGAGKSLTGAAVIGLLRPPGRITSGKIWIDGKRVDDLSPQAMAKIRGKTVGAIFQDPMTSLNPLFTIGDQLVETIRTHLPLSRAQAQARAIALLTEVGIPAPDQRFGQYPHQLSGGMRQRVVIALALCADPKLIIADEPTTALDVSIQAQIIGVIKKLCAERGTSFMLVTHDMGVIAETADQVAVMYAGRVVECGAVADVIRRPRHPYTKGLIASIPALHDHGARLYQIEGTMPRLTAIPQGCAFNPRCPQAFDTCWQAKPQVDLTRSHQIACWLQEEPAR